MPYSLLEVAVLALDVVRQALDDAGTRRLDELLVGGRGVDLRLLATLHAEAHLSVHSLLEVVGSLPIRVRGSETADRFSAGVRIGSGASGQVFLVEDSRLGRAIAVKTLDTARDERAQRLRFGNEVRITAQLTHPGIVAIHDASLDDGPLSYSMQLVRGETLKAVIARAAKTGRPSLIRRLEIFLDVCDAIGYAHRRGVLHRDLKPANVMVGAHGQVVVLDWGIALPVGFSGADALAAASDLDDESDYDDETGVTGGAVGTPAYMSPEQAHGEVEALTVASDQFALGLILQEVVTLRRARSAATSIQTLYRAMKGERDAIRPRTRPTRIARELVSIIDKATAIVPQMRYHSVPELAEDVRRYLADEPVLARPDGVLQFLGRAVARHRTMTVSLVLALIVAVLGVVIVGGGTTVVVHERQRASAERREQRLADAQRHVRDRAGDIERELLVIEGLLRGVAGAVEVSLAGPVPDVHVYRAAHFSDPATSPADMAPSLVYGGLASLEHPDIVVSNGVDATALRDDMRRLAAVGPNLGRAVVSSLGANELTPGQLEHQIRNKAAPLVWAYAATESGLLVGYPGTGFYPDHYDARTRGWYRSAAEAQDLVWTAIDVDESGLGLLLTCAMPVRDAAGGFIGVAAVDLTFAHVINELMAAPEQGGEAWLISADGDVIVRSSQRDSAREAPRDWAPPPFPYPDVLAQLRGSGGHLEMTIDGQRQLVLWRRIDRMGWTYVVTGDVRRMMRLDVSPP